jgi:class 3 adenylate cyclase
MDVNHIKRRLAAIVSADVKEYSRLMREDEAATVRTLTAYREIMADLIRQHHGRVVDSPGDNLLAEYASVVDAVQSAVAIQKELKARNADIPESRRLEFRIGINLGDVIVEDDRIYGDGVNIAARLEGLADPGGICISRTAFDQIEDKLPLGYEYLGEKIVKNISKPIRAYKVLMEPDEISFGAGEKETVTGEKETVTGQEERGFKTISIERGFHRGSRSKARFRRHLRTFVVVNLFLLLINLITNKESLWFYWITLFWGLFLFLRWLRLRESRDRKGEAFYSQPPAEEKPMRASGQEPKYLRIQVNPGESTSGDEETVNIRVPLKLLKTGAKLASILPERSKNKVNQALKEKGLDFDISSLEGEKLEELLRSLSELSVEVDSDDRKVRIYCE